MIYQYLLNSDNNIKNTSSISLSEGLSLFTKVVSNKYEDMINETDNMYKILESLDILNENSIILEDVEEKKVGIIKTLFKKIIEFAKWLKDKIVGLVNKVKEKLEKSEKFKDLKKYFKLSIIADEKVQERAKEIFYDKATEFVHKRLISYLDYIQQYTDDNNSIDAPSSIEKGEYIKIDPPILNQSKLEEIIDFVRKYDIRKDLDSATDHIDYKISSLSAKLDDKDELEKIQNDTKISITMKIAKFNTNKNDINAIANDLYNTNNYIIRSWSGIESSITIMENYINSLIRSVELDIKKSNRVIDDLEKQKKQQSLNFSTEDLQYNNRLREEQNDFWLDIKEDELKEKDYNTILKLINSIIDNNMNSVKILLELKTSYTYIQDELPNMFQIILSKLKNPKNHEYEL